jgi:predicted GNAT family acetyltransferase
MPTLDMTPPDAAVAVVHNAGASRFEATVEGQLCVANYHVYGPVMMLTHTGVPRPLRGRGIAAQMIQAALDLARARGLKVRPDCSYAEAYMQRHPLTQDLLMP